MKIVFYLNIWTPKISSSARLPVMVWIHGGASVFGASHNPIYDGEKIAEEKQIILVTINYRIGVFGYLAHPALTSESENNSSGNYGLMDQIAALEWVKENIDGFGGNPYNVTIFGQSAGGTAVLDLMTTSYASGLFQKAIAQSPWDDDHHYRQLKNKIRDQESAEDIGKMLAGNLGLEENSDTLTKLREASAEELIEAAKKIGKPGTVFSSIIDGYILEYHPFKILQDGIHNKVPLIVGLNANEGDIFLIQEYFNSADEYVAFIKENFGPLTDEALTLYPACEDSLERREQMIKLFSDRKFLIPALYLIEEVSSISSAWLYYYKYTDPYFTAEALKDQKTTIGAYHGAEVKMVFGKINNTVKNQIYISDTMMSYWTNFAKNGNPNEEGLPEWIDYNTKPKTYLEIDKKISTQKKLNNKRYKFFKKLVDQLI